MVRAAYAVHMLHATGTVPVSALDIATPVVSVVDLVILVATIGTALYALVHSVTQRSDAFAAAGKLSKPAWLGINAGAVLLSLLAALQPRTGIPSLFAIIAITASLVYIVDVRPAVREVSGGGPSPW
jgi:hypothetical protein